MTELFDHHDDGLNILNSNEVQDALSAAGLTSVVRLSNPNQVEESTASSLYNGSDLSSGSESSARNKRSRAIFIYESAEHYLQIDESKRKKHKSGKKLRDGFKTELHRIIFEEVWKDSKYCPGTEVELEQYGVLERIWRRVEFDESNVTFKLLRAELRSYVVYEINDRMSYLRTTRKTELDKKMKGMYMDGLCYVLQ